MEWYLSINGNQIGPMTTDQLISQAPGQDALVWKNGMADWQPLYTVPELMMRFNERRQSVQQPMQQQYGAQQPQYYGAQGNMTQPSYNTPAPEKSKTTFALLALLPALFGIYGIQYFYVGKTKAALLFLLTPWILWTLFGCLSVVLGVFTLGLSLIGLVIPAIFAAAEFILFVVQGIMVLSMDQQKFEEKFVYTDKAFPLF